MTLHVFRRKLRGVYRPSTGCLLTMVVLLGCMVVFLRSREAGNPKTSSDLLESLPPGEWSDSCEACFHPNIDVLLDNKDLCSTQGNASEVDVLILINSHLKNTRNRNAIRNTWASVGVNNLGRFRYMFLLGSLPGDRDDSANKAILKYEHFTHGDILQSSLQDNYRNVLLKTINAFEWSIHNCANAKFVLKTDDTVYVNTNTILKSLLIKYNKDLQDGVGGLCWEQGKVVDRNPESTLYVPKRVYSGSIYPPFCNTSGGYITSMKNIHKMYEISVNTPYFPLEDVYIGYLLKKCGIDLINIAGFRGEYSDRLSMDTLCVNTSSVLYTLGGMGDQDMYDIWDYDCKD